MAASKEQEGVVGGRSQAGNWCKENKVAVVKYCVRGKLVVQLWLCLQVMVLPCLCLWSMVNQSLTTHGYMYTCTPYVIE